MLRGLAEWHQLRIGVHFAADPDTSTSVPVPVGERSAAIQALPGFPRSPVSRRMGQN